MRLAEKEIIPRFQNTADKYAPLKIIRVAAQAPLAEGLCADAIIEFSIPGGPSFEALVEAKALATPRAIREACRQLAAFLTETGERGLVPIIIAPYVGKRQAEILEQEGVSWLDLSGNMMVRVPNKIYIERTGKPNRFPDTAPIKKVFQGTASLVSRALLLKPQSFRSLYEVVDFINERDASITLSTVSKVLKSLEEGLLITRDKACVSVIDAERLIEKLTEGYINYTERSVSGRYRFAIDSIEELFTMFYESKVNYAACGFYAAKLKGLATTDQFMVFIKSIEEAKRAFELSLPTIEPDTEFGQLQLIETKNPCVWFNVQGKPFNNTVDDIELYLEMMVDTPRGPKIAEVLRERILRGDIDG